MGGMSAASSDVSEMVIGGEDSNNVTTNTNPPAAGISAVVPGASPSTVSVPNVGGGRSVSFTSPKKAFMMRVGEQQSSTSSNTSSANLPSNAQGSQQQSST